MLLTEVYKHCHENLVYVPPPQKWNLAILMICLLCVNLIKK